MLFAPHSIGRIHRDRSIHIEGACQLQETQITWFQHTGCTSGDEAKRLTAKGLLTRLQIGLT